MNSAKEARGKYLLTNALAAKSLQKNKKQGLTVCPAVLNTFVDDRMIAYRLDLGLLEIPVNLIAGVAESSEKSMLYTKEFLPISAPDSEFANTWRGIYEKYLNHEEIFSEISCYEYLGKFYVLDGLKRVSVTKFLGTPTMKAQVVRIIPIRTDVKEVERYFDFLGQYRLTQLYQLQFTQQGFFDQLQIALGKSVNYRWSEGDRSRFLMHWYTIEEAFRKSYGETLNITTADALVVLLRKYPYEQIIRMESWILARIFQASWKELCALSLPKLTVVGIKPQVPQLQTA